MIQPIEIVSKGSGSFRIMERAKVFGTKEFFFIMQDQNRRLMGFLHCYQNLVTEGRWCFYFSLSKEFIHTNIFELMRGLVRNISDEVNAHSVIFGIPNDWETLTQAVKGIREARSTVRTTTLEVEYE